MPVTGATQPALAVKLVSKAAAGATFGGTWRLLRAGHAGRPRRAAGGRRAHTSHLGYRARLWVVVLWGVVDP
eukprot:scaffold20760_cov57-Phaeocystis_antarctica.AAC.1